MVSEVYKIKRKMFRRQDLLHWKSQSNKLNFLNSPLIWERRSDLSGVELKTVLSPNKPTAILEIKKDTILKATGFSIDLYTALQARLNFSISFKLPPDSRTYGVRLSNGSWTGMIGSLDRREVDMSPQGLAVTAARKKVIEYSRPVLAQKCKLYVALTTVDHGENFFAYLEVFSVQFWLVFAAFSLVLPVAYVLITKLVSPISTERKSFVVQFLEYFAMVSTSWLGRPFSNDHNVPKNFSLRILHFTNLMSTSLLYISYSAALTSVLTLTIFTLPIKELRQVFGLKYGVTIWKGSVYEDYFRNAAPDSLSDQVWTRILAPNPGLFVKDHFSGLLKLLDEPNNVYFGPDLSVRSVIQNKQLNCNFSELPFTYSEYGYAMGFVKGSELLPIFNYYITKLAETGTLNRLKRKYYPIDFKTGQACKAEQKETQRIGYERTVGLFVVLLAGIVWSLLHVLLEKAHTFIRRRL